MSESDDDLPIATPISPPTPPVPVPSSRREPPRQSGKPQPPTDPKPPRPRALAACAVIGCFGLAVLGAVALLTTTAIMLVGHLGNEIAERTKDAEDTGPEETAKERYVGPVMPTKLQNASLSIPLGTHPVTNVTLGGNGRFLLMRVGDKILVFDPSEGSLQDPFEIKGPAVSMAASASKLYVHRPGHIDRYNLMTRKLEKSVAFAGLVRELAIGSGSEGPLFAFLARGLGSSIVVLDTETLEPLDGVQGLRQLEVLSTRVCISHDGGWLGLDLSTPIAMLSRDTPVLHYQDSNRSLTAVKLLPDTGRGPLTPSADGQFFYSNRGVYRNDGSHVLKPQNPAGFFVTLPTAQGDDFFLSLGVKDTKFIAPEINVHLAGSASRVPEREPFAELVDFAGPDGSPVSDARDGLTPADRVHFWPAAGLILVIPQPGHENIPATLEVRKVDVKKLLDSADDKPDYPIILSDPPRNATKGQTWRYSLQAWSARGNVKFSLVKAPRGMELTETPDGTVVSWAVPADYPPLANDIEIRATEAGGRRAEQRFRLQFWEPVSP